MYVIWYNMISHVWLKFDQSTDRGFERVAQKISSDIFTVTNAY